MAVGGISRLIDNLATGLSQLTAAGSAPSQSPSSQGGGGHDDGADFFRRPHKFVNIDGVVLDRNAPRGTYVDILV